ncbi:hypothetical protein OIU74_009230 [Salix koriyanagi]|uniref:Uncharacterized protein n=1 Tax=Salix koriyanagi TaxID=2511006 RepID=A0A9Q0Z0A3_9ROSI|nr:hypothetical protein OIU74_009230 [Salix koriyanagi]
MCASLSLIPSLTSGSQLYTFHRILLSSRSARSKSYPFFTRSRVSMDSTVPLKESLLSSRPDFIYHAA